MQVSPYVNLQCCIGGQWVDADNGTTLDCFDTGSGKWLGVAPKMGAEDTRRAVLAAQKALPRRHSKITGERELGREGKKDWLEDYMAVQYLCMGIRCWPAPDVKLSSGKQCAPQRREP
jgi:hypothetical protein